MEKAVGNKDQRKYVENDEAHYGMYVGEVP